MNKVYLLLFSIFFIAKAEAQYSPMFGNTETAWFEYSDLKELGGRSTFNYYTVGDSIVDGKVYWVINYDWVSELDTIRNDRAGLYREDVINKKVYQLNAPTSIKRENLMYDFSKSAGDTIKLGVNVQFIVDSVSNSINLCDKKIATDRNVFYLSYIDKDPSFQVIWVEGVGNLASFGLYETPVVCDKKEALLICKMSDSNIDYHNNEVEGFEDCPFEITTSVKNLPQPLEIKLYPNPSRADIYISGNAIELGNAQYKVFDITGRTMLQGKLPIATTTKINTGQLETGVYFLEVFNPDQNLLTNKKFIITQ
ncbi:T9SS type A sorting domain-containing protein [Membranihabitans marinus]|uniref:T9SS type A sorting domain-containing protein n=1 Tax=Membranihabitans marinus TaxID=1227546 RepID=UPI001F1F98CF|nr:T9SS type A sorting domain-containing protein [Membranihabitans marinus]